MIITKALRRASHVGFLLLLSVAITVKAHAGNSKVIQRWVKGTTQEIFVQFTKPLNPNFPTLVFLNGLTYEYDNWDALIEYLRPLGYGLIQYDPVGHGQSLLRYGAPTAPVSIESQADDLNLITRALGLTGKLNLVGLSYGGGLAIAFANKYSHRIENAFLLAPYTEPLEAQDRWIQQQIQIVRLWQPWVTATDEELYAHFLRLNVFTIFPLAEKSILSIPEKRESVFQLIQGVRKFNMNEASQKFSASSVHLVIAGLDQYIPRVALERFWQQLPSHSKSTKMVIRLSEHKLPESFPLFTASWIHQVIRYKSSLEKKTEAEDTLYDHVIDIIPIFK